MAIAWIEGPGPGFLKLGLDNPGLVWNFISDPKALKEYSGLVRLSTIWWLNALKRIGRIIPKGLLNREI